MRPSCVLRFALSFGCAVPLTAQVTQAEYAARRDALAKSLAGDGVTLVLGAPEPKENYQNFWQAEDFRYLTGFLEPGAALVFVRRDGVEHRLLFVQPKDPAAEVWTGERLGVAGVAPRMGLEGRDAATLRSVLDSLLAPGGALHAVGDFSSGGADVPGTAAPRTADDQFLDAVKAKHRKLKVDDATPRVLALRGRKSAAELALIRMAATVSAAAHREVLHAIAPGMAEFEVQALAEYTFRRNGADGPSYGSIVGSGPNSTTLHYDRDDRFMRDGEVVNMDMAAYYAGYSADLTRTVPVNGRFSPEQRAVYAIVREAQDAAERQVRPGASFRVLGDSALAVLKQGLATLGLIESPDASYDCGTAARASTCPQYRLYYMHAIGHPIGLDVHDVDVADRGAFVEGSVFTIEPGAYVRANTVDIIPDTPANAAFRARLAPAVRRYANIGVRIEDDYIVTAAGFDRITSDAPREMDEIEREMAVKAGPAARDSARVDAYKRLKP
ncbi:MAG: aminopeptidase P N-terminal domain-containing protein [Gemmatimonadetes bacterium]|nr:aminopeptidase P N-terminal domain-containing protein [Gemmatimonadota bacterium]